MSISAGSLRPLQNPFSVSMEIDPDVKDNVRKYPSIKDYYVAGSKTKDKPIQLQPGLSNYSSVQLGDDRITFNESILSESYRLPVEAKMVIESPSKNKTLHSRRRDYDDALFKVGDVELDRLERVMKDKLFQRSYATSSPFQVRKAFKFFDRENSMRISIEGFTSALEFLGFQFSELQNLALFARYDPECLGAMDFMTFIEKAMFYAAVEPIFGARTRVESKDILETFNDVPDIAAEEANRLQEAEFKRIFNKLDSSKSGKLNRDQFEMLLMAIGYNVSSKELDRCLKDLDVRDGEAVSFNSFFEWWSSNIGAIYLNRK